MKILDKYIFKQVLAAVLIWMLMSVVVLMAPEILFRIIRDTIYDRITLETALRLFLLEIPEILSKAIPVGFMLGSLYVFDRMSKDSELTIIRSVGIKTRRLFVPVIVLSIVGAFICNILFNNLIPYTTSTVKNLRKDVAQSHFIYTDKYPSGAPKNILIVGSYSNGHIYEIKYLAFSETESMGTPMIKSIIVAYWAEAKKDHWLLHNGFEYTISPKGIYEETKSFEKMKIFDEKTSRQAKDLLVYSTKRPKEMTVPELHNYMNLLHENEMEGQKQFIVGKIYQRSALSLGCILFAICGVLLGFNRPREKRFIGYTLGVGLIFIYYIILPFLDLLAQAGTFPAFFIAWIPNLIIITAIGLLIKFKEI